MDKRGDGVSRFSVKIVWSHSSENLHRGTLLCFTKFLVSKKFMDKRGDGVSRFSVRIFLSHSAEKIRRWTLQGVTDFGYRKILCLRGWCHDFSSIIFVSLYRKTLQGNRSVLYFGKFPVANKFMDNKGGVSNFLSHSAEKCRRGTL